MKLFNVKDQGLYAADSKKDLKEFLNLPMSRISNATMEDTIDQTVIDINFLRKLEDSINDGIARSQFINEPNRFFEIGEPIQVGNLTKFVVKEILLNGKLIMIEEISDNYNQTYELIEEKKSISLESNVRTYRIIAWHDLFKKKDLSEYPESLFANDNLNFSFYNMTIESLLTKQYYSGIEMNPDYQRELVWSHEDKLLLLDSIFNELDIGKFVFVQYPFDIDKPAYEILDGKQRLSTILDFYEDRIQYKGFYFSDLSPMDKRRFCGTQVVIGIVNERNISKEKIVKYFLKLNSTGKPVSKDFLEDLRKRYI